MSSCWWLLLGRVTQHMTQMYCSHLEDKKVNFWPNRSHWSIFQKHWQNGHVLCFDMIFGGYPSYGHLATVPLQYFEYPAHMYIYIYIYTSTVKINKKHTHTYVLSLKFTESNLFEGDALHYTIDGRNAMNSEIPKMPILFIIFLGSSTT